MGPMTSEISIGKRRGLRRSSWEASPSEAKFGSAVGSVKMRVPPVLESTGASWTVRVTCGFARRSRPSNSVRLSPDAPENTPFASAWVRRLSSSLLNTRASQAVLQTAALGLGVAAGEMAVDAELTHNACLGAVPGWRTQGQRDFLERAIVVDDEDE